MLLEKEKILARLFSKEMSKYCSNSCQLNMSTQTDRQVVNPFPNNKFYTSKLKEQTTFSNLMAMAESSPNG